MIAPSRAKSFFDEIVEADRPVGFLEELISKPRQDQFEREYIDFKGEPKPDDLPKIWSKALSCLANSDGGVLIWGIEAPEGAPIRLSPVRDWKTLDRDLHQMLRDVTDPPVSGVDIRAYPVSEGSQSGFIVCYIPASPWRPHRAKRASNEFYMRAGDNCVPCSLTILRALFAPQSVCNLKVHWRTRVATPQISPMSPGHFYYWLELSLENAGPSTARDVLLTYKPNSGSKRAVGDFWFPPTAQGDTLAFLARRPLHPIENMPAINEVIGWFQRAADPMTRDIKETVFHIRVWAEDQLPVDFELDLTAAVQGKVVTSGILNPMPG